MGKGNGELKWGMAVLALGLALFAVTVGALPALAAHPSVPLDVVVSEIAWTGTAASGCLTSLSGKVSVCLEKPHHPPCSSPIP